MNYSLDGAPIQAELDLLLLIACPETFLGSQELNFCFLIKKKSLFGTSKFIGKLHIISCTKNFPLESSESR